MQSSPYSPSNAHADSSSRAIASATTPHPEISTPRSSSHIPPASLSSRPQTIGLAEQFNQPLRPHIWTSKRKWTRHELTREREEFFDTRVTGRPEIWGTLKMVVGLVGDGELQTAQGILDAAGVTVPTGDLVNGVYDEAGNFYQMPEEIVADPDNSVVEIEELVHGEVTKGEDRDMDEEELERRREEKGKGVLKLEDAIKVRARLSDRGGQDVIIMLSKEQSVRVLIKKVQEEAGVRRSSPTPRRANTNRNLQIFGMGTIRIAYLGKILKEGDSLLAQGWREGHVVNALVFQ
ncbi:hypothetical protein MMC13_004559 [Lambiella insularis]|nr:hypothetical protein [Lambiella insularis]